MSGVAIACHTIYQPHRLPWPHNVVAHGIAHAFGPTNSVCTLVFAIMLVHPRSLGKGEVVAKVKLMDVAINLNHVVF